MRRGVVSGTLATSSGSAGRIEEDEGLPTSTLNVFRGIPRRDRVRQHLALEISHSSDISLSPVGYARKDVIYPADRPADQITNDECVDESDEAPTERNPIPRQEGGEQPQMGSDGWAALDHKYVSRDEQAKAKQQTDGQPPRPGIESHTEGR